MRVLRRPIFFLIAAAMSALALVAAPAAASSLAPVASANPIGTCGEGVQTFRQTGPITAWGIRTTGVGLTGQLGITTGRFYVNIDSPNGPDLSRIIPFDEFNPPSAFHTINGPTARVSVYVEPVQPPTGRSCTYRFDATYPGP